MYIVIAVPAAVLLIVDIILFVSGKKSIATAIVSWSLFVLSSVASCVWGFYGGNLIWTILLGCAALFSLVVLIVSMVRMPKEVAIVQMERSSDAARSDGNEAQNAAADGTPFKDAIIDRSNNVRVTFTNEDGADVDFIKIDSLYSSASGSNKLYAILKMADGAKDTAFVAEYVEDGNCLVTPKDDVADKVFAEWKQSLSSPSTMSVKNIAVYDTIVHKADWKKFRKHATQEELTVLAIGSKLQLSGAKFYAKSIISVIGTILSIVLGVAMVSDFGVFAIIILVGGYLFFNLMASKLLGYSDTYNSCYRKLDQKNRQYIKSLFKESVVISILRTIVLACLSIFTIPYKFLLMIIETFVPAARNWTVAHGGEAGAVVTLPKGCDIGGLAAAGQYYASCSFGDAWNKQMEEYEAAQLAKYVEYTYNDENGVTRTAYSNDGMHFYADKKYPFVEVGTSTDGGNTIELK